jgi:hypothetical protein
VGIKRYAAQVAITRDHLLADVLRAANPTTLVFPEKYVGVFSSQRSQSPKTFRHKP